MTVTQNKVQTARVSGGTLVVSYLGRIFGDILAIGFPISGIALGFLGEDDRGGRRYHSVPFEPIFSISYRVQIRTNRIVEIGVRQRGRIGLMSAGANVDALGARPRGFAGVVQVAEFRRIYIRRKNINPCAGTARKITTVGAIVGVVFVPVVIVHIHRQCPLVHVAETSGSVGLLPGLV